ncbi:biotin transporter BioY [Halostella litorea]|uniref:biotin transporter BioY n=1 Tax=Halostella litorea TaxID=2528831 RepID=UPI00109305DB|nr:biotin transporter BioY [Halostella litorea]
MSTDTDSVELVDDLTVGYVAQAALLAAFVGAGAYVSFPLPFSSVPVTLQVLGVFLAGIVLGPVWGAASMVLYLAVGAIGVPVFAGGGAGVGTLLGPTGGYLWSYPVAAALIGGVVHRGIDLRDPATVSVPVVAAALVAGTVVIYAFGVAGLVAVAGYGVAEAVSVGALVFAPGEAVKIAAATAVARSGQLPTR